MVCSETGQQNTPRGWTHKVSLSGELWSVTPRQSTVISPAPSSSQQEKNKPSTSLIQFPGAEPLNCKWYMTALH